MVDNNKWFGSLITGLEDHYKPKMKLLDYGCGGGGLVDFMISKENFDFTYYGFEKPGGTNCTVNFNLLTDPRISFAFLDPSEKFDQFVQIATCAVVGSIFTHITIKDTLYILNRLSPIVDRGGIISFSAFIGDEYSEEGYNAYGFRDCYHQVIHTENTFYEWCLNKGYDIKHSGEYDTNKQRLSNKIQHIYSIGKK